MSIPKVIHYCWFGKKTKTRLIIDCIESWKTKLPEYEIKEWNESNYKSDSFFFKKSMALKKYAFASDYARFDILYKYGGIYLDTDMLMIKGLNDLLENNCFFGYETQNNISCGIIGAVKNNNKIIKFVLNELDTVSSESYFKSYSIVKVLNIIINIHKNEGLDLELIAYPIDYFYPFPYESNESPDKFISPNTYSIHLWNASWFEDFERSKLFLSTGRKKEARFLYLKTLFKKPHYIKYFFDYV